MILADTIAIFLSVIGVILATNALWLFNFSVWNSLVLKSGDIFVESPWKSFFLGLIVFVITIFVVGLLAKLGKGPNELLNLILLSLFVLLSSIGVAGFATKIGEKLELDKKSKWKGCLFGGLILELTFILPILGWVVLFPVSTITGCGAAIRAKLRLRKATKATVQPDENVVSNPSEKSGNIV